MLSSANPLIVIGTYTTIIFSVMFASGKMSERSLYDDFFVSLVGTELRVTNPRNSGEFISRVLGFRVQDRESEAPNVELPDRRRILLRRYQDIPREGSSTLFIAVQNGLKRLHRTIVRRSGKEVFSVSAGLRGKIPPAGRVSEQFWLGKYRAFAVSDLDGNLFVFYTPDKKRALPRWP